MSKLIISLYVLLTMYNPASVDLPVHQRSQRQQVPWFRNKCDYDPYFANGACQFWHAYQYEHFGKILSPAQLLRQEVNAISMHPLDFLSGSQRGVRSDNISRHYFAVQERLEAV